MLHKIQIVHHDGMRTHSTHPDYLAACEKARELKAAMPSLEYRLFIRPINTHQMVMELLNQAS